MLSGNRVAIIVEEGFEESELMESVKALKDAGAKVVMVGSDSQNVYQGKRKKSQIKININAVEANASDFDAVIITGAYTPEKKPLHQSIVDMIKEAFDSGKIVAAICHGPRLLILAGILEGRRVTSWPSMGIDLRNVGADWVDEAVVRDGNLITSRKPVDIPKFNKAIIDALKERYGIDKS